MRRLAFVVALAAACSAEVANGTSRVAPAADAGDRTEDQVLAIADHAAGDIYGAAVALHGELAVVACEYDDDRGADSGSVHVFRDDGESWVHEQKLLASDGEAGDNFGRAVAVQGDRIVVGAHWDDDQGANAGSAYVFRHDGERWVQEQKLLAPGGRVQDRFGVSVSLDGDVIAVAAWLADGETRDEGAVHVFRLDGERWAHEQTLAADDAATGAHFGRSVSVSGNRLLVGAWKDDAAGTDAGAAYAFRHDGERWVQEQKLTAAGAVAGDRFGWCAWLDGTVALIGAWKSDAAADGRGAAWVFRHDGERWVQEQRLAAGDGTKGDGFGFSTVIDGDTALVGAHRARTDAGRSGAAYVFRREDGRWIQARRLLPKGASAGDAYGFQAALHDGNALVGAWRTAQAGRETGSAYGYRGVVSDT
ncbi:MAG: FG-GAP repeat protein [Planctomycetota bacterium]|jgi:hypothetical protein